MPTGYTADLEGVTFPEFALRCARAFGALITLRDEAFDAPLPDCIKPFKYHLAALEKSIKTLLKIDFWSGAQAESEWKANYAMAVENRETKLKGSSVTRKQYENMIVCVEDWTPPTPDHVGLKDFMLKQLIESIEFDCLGEGDFSMPQAQSGLEYQHRRLCRVLQDIEYYAKSYREELVRSRERTEWLRELRLSLD